MKNRILGTLIIAAALGLQSCNDYLDVNKNPNAATTVDASLALPTGIVRSASLTVSYNTYGGQIAGYIANAGGFSGFGNLLTYDYVPGTGSQWDAAYDNLMDYKVVLDKSEGRDDMRYFKAVADIMSVLEFHRISDQVGDIPYTESLLGNTNINPKYEKGPAVYQALIERLNTSIAAIKGAELQVSLNSSSDPLFKGDMTKWVQFANTLKLRLLVRISGVSSLSSFVQAQFASLENNFIADDAIVNPGYAADRANPTWASWGYATNGNLANSSRVPTYYIYGYYDGAKLTDPARGRFIYNDFGNSSRPTPLNQLGVEQGNPAVRANYSPWYTGVRNSATSITNSLGVVKGPTQGQPIMLLAEAHFLLAEARLKGFLSGDYKTSFENGIRASYRYLYKDVNGTVVASSTVNGIVAGTEAAFIADYKLANESSYLVNLDLAGSDEQKLESIITQKYIALNMIDGSEAWNDYRRTGYPKSTRRGGRYVDLASTTSNATAADGLPTLIKYPISEYNYNADNVIDLNVFTDKIFWAKQ